jgi:hypothetical protein
MSEFTNQPAANLHAADALADLSRAVESLKENRPDERSELARVYAVTITQAEMVLAYFQTYATGVLDNTTISRYMQDAT